MNWDHMTFSQAAFVLIALPCMIKCLVDLLAWEPKRRNAEPDRSAVRGTQLLDANGFFRRDFK
jgi:hypothetical protein